MGEVRYLRYVRFGNLDFSHWGPTDLKVWKKAYPVV